MYFQPVWLIVIRCLRTRGKKSNGPAGLSDWNNKVSSCLPILGEKGRCSEKMLGLRNTVWKNSVDIFSMFGTCSLYLGEIKYFSANFDDFERKKIIVFS